MGMGRLSAAERASLASARGECRKVPQRTLAAKMYKETDAGQVGHGLRFRSKATIYGALRRLDAGNLRPGKVQRSLAHV